MCSLWSSEFLTTDDIPTSIGNVRIVEAYEGNGYDRNNGNSGRQWVVFLEGKNVGTLWAHRGGMKIEEFGGKVRLWTCIRGGGSTGRLGYYYISDDGVSDLESIVVHPGDNGTDLSNSITSVLFDASLTAPTAMTPLQVIMC
jgi:hypothetical protein